MPAIQIEQSVAAGGTVANLVAGSAFEFARSRTLVSLGLTAAATGTFAFINSGADVVLEESPPYVSTLFPIVPDQMFYNDIMEMFDRLRVQIRNSTGGAIVARSLALLTPL